MLSRSLPLLCFSPKLSIESVFGFLFPSSFCSYIFTLIFLNMFLLSMSVVLFFKCVHLRVMYMYTIASRTCSHMERGCYDDMMLCICYVLEHVLVEYVSCCSRFLLFYLLFVFLFFLLLFLFSPMFIQESRYETLYICS